MRWRVIVDGNQKGWDGNWVKGMDAQDAAWTDAWDGILPGFKTRRFETEREADSLARALRAKGFTAQTEEMEV